MARLFDDATTEYLEVDTAPVTAAPMTVSCWFQADQSIVNTALVFIGDKDVDNQGWRLECKGSFAGDPVAWISNAFGTATAESTTGATLNTWHHACGVEYAADSRAAFIDGGSKGTNTTSAAPPGADRLSVGRWGRLTPGTYHSGLIAELAIWNAALTDAEVATLARGVSPLRIRRANLVRYYPLFARTGNAEELSGAASTLVDFNTVGIADHPPVAPPFAFDAAFYFPASAAITKTGRLTAGQGDLVFDPKTGRLVAAQGDLVYDPKTWRLTTLQGDLVYDLKTGLLTAAQGDLIYDPKTGRVTAAQGDLVYDPKTLRLTSLQADLVFSVKTAGVTALQGDIEYSVYGSRVTAAEGDLVYDPKTGGVVAVQGDIVYDIKTVRLVAVQGDIVYTIAGAAEPTRLKGQKRPYPIVGSPRVSRTPPKVRWN